MFDKYTVFLILLFGFLSAFLVITFFLQKKAVKDQSKVYKDYLKDSLLVLEENNKYIKRIAEALEKKNDGK